MNTQELKRRGQIVSEAIILVHETKALSHIAVALKNLINDGLWRSFVNPATGEVINYADDEWLKFVYTKPSYGLGTTMEAIEEIAKAHSDEVYKLVRRMNESSLPPLDTNEEKDAKGGRGNKKDIDISVSLTSQDLGGGMSRKYTIAKLKRDAPDLAVKVIDDEITAAEARRELKTLSATGKSKPTIKKQSIPINDADLAFKALTYHMDFETLYDLIDLLNDWRDSQG